MKKALLPQLFVLSVFALSAAACGTNTPASTATSSKGESSVSSSRQSVHEHEYVHHAETPATCTENGKAAYYTCSGCGKIFNEQKEETTAEKLVIAALGHDLSYHDETLGTDCLHKGTIEYYSCSRCEAMFSDRACEHELASIEGDIGPHQFVAHEAKTSTCAGEGNKAYYTCEICNGVFDENHQPTTMEEIIIPAGTHVLEYHHDETDHWQECKNCDFVSKHEAHAYGEYEKGNAIGEMKASCACGATDGKLMTKDDFVLGEDLYGSSVTTDSTGNTWVGKSSEKQAYVFGRDGGSEETFTLNMPLVEIKNYSSVTFSFTVASGWFKIGSDADHIVNAQGDGATGYIKTQKSYDGEVKVTFYFANNSNYPGSPLLHSYTLDDQDVLDGLAPLSIYATNVANVERCVFLTEIALEGTCEHDYAYVADEEIIGTSHNTNCSKCGAPVEESGSRVSQTGDVNYSYSTHGAKLSRVNQGAYYGGEYVVENGILATDSAVSYVADGEYVAFRAEMPKVNYSLYSSVSFPLTVGNAHYGMALENAVWNESGGIRGSNLSVTLSITVQGANSLSVQLIWGPETISKTIESSDIYEGAAGVPVYFSVASKAALEVGSPTLNLAE